MAKVSTFLYCLGTENQHNPKGPINAIGILPVLTPEFIPSAFSFAIVVGIVGLEKDRDHILNVCFKDNNNNPLIDSNDIRISVDTMKEGDLDLPNEARGIILSMELRNAILREEGMYSTEIVLDGKNLGEYEIYAKAKAK